MNPVLMGIRRTTAARIVSLRRYMALLHHEEHRLEQVLASPGTPRDERINAETALKVTSDKLSHAQLEILKLKD